MSAATGQDWAWCNSAQLGRAAVDLHSSPSRSGHLNFNEIRLASKTVSKNVKLNIYIWHKSLLKKKVFTEINFAKNHKCSYAYKGVFLKERTKGYTNIKMGYKF